MQRYINNVETHAGAAVVGALVSVFAAGGGSATIYSDNGVTVQSNPITTDDNGVFAFYAANGVYSIIVTSSGVSPVTVTGILLDDPDAQVLNQAATNLNYAQNGAKIQRINDRIFLGGATASDGALPNVTKDWLSTFQVAAGLANGTSLNTQAVFLNSNSADANVGFLAASRSLNFTNAAASCIGGMSVAVNNNATLGTEAWGHYIEAHRTTAAATSTYGMEIDTRTLTASIDPHPWQFGDVVVFQAASGAGLAAGGQFDASAAHQIAANPMKFKKGIVFRHDSLTGSSGGVGEACAMAMAITQNLEWFNSSGVRAGYIKVNTSNVSNRTGLIFNDTGAYIVGNAEQPLMLCANVASAVNYPQIVPAIAGAPVQFLAQGNDTNIDAWLRVKGSGKPMFGTLTVNADAPVTGYISIKDDGGNLRKLAVIA